MKDEEKAGNEGPREQGNKEQRIGNKGTREWGTAAAGAQPCSSLDIDPCLKCRMKWGDGSSVWQVAVSGWRSGARRKGPRRNGAGVGWRYAHGRGETVAWNGDGVGADGVLRGRLCADESQAGGGEGWFAAAGIAGGVSGGDDAYPQLAIRRWGAAGQLCGCGREAGGVVCAVRNSRGGG